MDRPEICAYGDSFKTVAGSVWQMLIWTVLMGWFVQNCFPKQEINHFSMKSAVFRIGRHFLTFFESNLIAQEMVGTELPQHHCSKGSTRSGGNYEQFQFSIITKQLLLKSNNNKKVRKPLKQLNFEVTLNATLEKLGTLAVVCWLQFKMWLNVMRNWELLRERVHLCYLPFKKDRLCIFFSMKLDRLEFMFMVGKVLKWFIWSFIITNPVAFQQGGVDLWETPDA